MKVVVLGCGFGGVEVARTLRKQAKELEIIMIDRRTRFGYLPSYPELLSGKVTPEDISGDLNKFATKIGAEFIHAEVVNIDFRNKEVKIKDKSKSKAEDKVKDISYDFLVLSIGAEQTFFGIPGAEELSCSVNTLEAAMETKNALDKLDYSKELSILVIGAGLTGVEVAGELVDYFRSGGATASIYLVEMMPRMLPAFPHESVANYVAKFLSVRGVAIMTETAVQGVIEHEILFKGGRKLPYDIIVWTAGVKPNSLLEKLEVPKVKGWMKVDPYLRVEGMDDVFAVGDTAYFEREGVRSGQNVEEAEEQGKVAAENIQSTIKGRKLREYRPRNTMQNPRAFISLGDDKAVAYSSKIAFTVFAYRIKKFVERRYMKRFR
ncbi:MAG TPA: FAD-dependent oxidoreductase [Candidatus Bathyarchaeia archaeon]|nr:FAD-dependent oxidoreductase [Candidatus Bathyarchaeia archaeon]